MILRPRILRLCTLLGAAALAPALPAHGALSQITANRGEIVTRIARTARIVLSAREMGRIFHAKGVERLVRNDLWKGRSPERFYDALEWLYGWKVDNCLAP